MDWRFVAYSVWFQSFWFLAVLGNQQWQWLSALLAAFTLLGSYLQQEIKLERVAVLVAVGIGLDFSNAQLGLLMFDTAFLPVWLVSLWLMFAWYAYFLLQKLSCLSVWSISLLGGVGGALSYIAGEKLGAVEFGFGIEATAAILLSEWLAMFWLIQKVYGDESANHNQRA
ncbi:DUF2878 domain-containing protein [Vibrio hepatarius]|uniref:DUF2878 domain-containing protein n=1 Tax=Vibrio hepatarius TaxID=171383 RepID=UPI00142E6101|nr:DUF2878 domain-containing protein [Vibrio hepatarius]NIY83807.1 DUF2878 domain-containing protein [Vibrio hepatarius]NVJ55276.1 DUF2878 domain-containing protein [Vibrionaceae bacterium]